MKRILIFLCFITLGACDNRHPQSFFDARTISTIIFLPPQWTPTITDTSAPDRTVLSTLSLPAPSHGEATPSSILDLSKQAQSIMDQGGYSLAIGIWDQVLAQDPQDDNAYYQRATCYYKMSQEKNVLEYYQSDIGHALRDIDAAIAIRGDIGDYYALRQSIYIGILSVLDVEVDREYIANIALENARKAYSLGTTLEPYPDRIIITDLLFSNQCQKALEELQLLLESTPADDSSRGGLLSIQSQVFSCLGRLEDAIDAIDTSMFNEMNLSWKKWLKSVYLYQHGEYEESLLLLDKLIAENYNGGGERFYLRAAIYFAQGKFDRVPGELNKGRARTWMRYEMLPYVEAQMALREGNTEQAIRILLYDETTFEPLFFPTQWKVQKQLSGLGVTPLNPTPSISITYPATPIPE